MIKKTPKILNDFGLKWAFNRGLYFLKIKTLNTFPIADVLFEKKADIKNIDLFKLNKNSIESFLLNLDYSEKNKIIKKANSAVLGRIMTFSSKELDYGYPIDWQLNPTTGKSHDKTKKWFQIPDFDKEVGDIKVIWEISRFTHFLDFARAYMITKDIKYFKSFEYQLQNWLDENKYSYGANYKCGQEATIRMINALIAYSVFREFDLVNDEIENNMKKLVEGSYKKVMSNFFYAHKCIRNNHTFTEILGRIIGAWATDNRKDVEYSMDLMNKEILNQFTNDGGFRQYSYNYHRFTLQIFEVLFHIEQTINVELSEKDIINRSVLLLYNLMNTDGFLPNYGSNDGALIFPLSNSDYRDYRPTLNTVYAQLNGEKLVKDGLHTEELLWFHKNENEISNLEKLPINLTEIGMYSFRDSESMALIHLNDYKTRPAHMDQLHFELWYKNIDIFPDLGTYSYASELGVELSENKSHNTVYIKDRNLMNKHGAFLVYDWSEIEDVSYEINKEFKGIVNSVNGYSHYRAVTKTSYGFLIKDKIRGNIKEYIINFHTPLDVRVEGKEIILSLKNKVYVRMETNEEVVLSKEFRSLYYLTKEEITKISILIKREGTTNTKIMLVE